MNLTAWIISVMEQLGYWGIALLMFLDNVFPPIPSEIIMPSAGYAASQGELVLVGSLLQDVLVHSLPLQCCIGSVINLNKNIFSDGSTAMVNICLSNPPM